MSINENKKRSYVAPAVSFFELSADTSGSKSAGEDIWTDPTNTDIPTV